MTRILVSEVGLRDGLQSIDRTMPTEAKKRWIAAEAAAGVREIEVGSFVPPKLLPQLADTAELVDFARGIEGLTVVGAGAQCERRGQRGEGGGPCDEPALLHVRNAQPEERAQGPRRHAGRDRGLREHCQGG